MFDLQFLAFQADITRVSTLLLAAESSRTNYAEIGLTSHYSTSHHGNNPENFKKYSKVNRYDVRCVRLAERVGFEHCQSLWIL